MTTEHDELRALRERAYGPSADIHDDPIAIARLRALEAAADRDAAPRREPEHDPAIEPDSGPAIEPESGPATVQDSGTDHDHDGMTRAETRVAARATADAGGEASGAPPSDETAPLGDDPAQQRQLSEGRGRLPRKIGWLWATSAAFALVAGVVAGVTAATWAGERTAVLAEADISDWPALSFGEAEEGSRIFEDYLGLTPVIVPNALGSDNQERVPCMFVVILSDYDGGDPPGTAATTVTAGCAAGAFPPVASFTVTDASPAALREALPVGTSVRFAVEGDEAHVTVRRP